MGKKKERCSKRKRRAGLLEKCANMTKKRKQSLEQCSENKTMESSCDCNKNQEMLVSFLKGNQDNTFPNYAELKNVLPATADTDDKNIRHNEGIPVAIIGKQCSSDNVSTEITVECTAEAPIEKETQNYNHFLKDILNISQPKSLFDCTSPGKTLEVTSERKNEPEVQDIGHKIIDVSHFA